MKKYLLSLTLMISGFTGFAQTNATNFTAVDCQGTSHTLFDELDNGKIIVLVWVMPCSYCINDAISGYEAVQSFSSSYPGKVLFYLSDDFGQTNCSTLSGWASTNGIPQKNITIFQNSGIPINEADYGGSGMPHVVVLGGKQHKVYLNIKNSSNNKVAIQNAISEAIAGTTATNELIADLADVVINPNVVKDKFSLEYSLYKSSEVKISIIDMAGVLIKAQNFGKLDSGKHSSLIDLNAPEGMYLLQVNAGDQTKLIKFAIRH